MQAMKQKKTEQIGLRTTPELRDQLERVAKANIRSIAQQAEYYIRQGLERDKAICSCAARQTPCPTEE